MKDKKGFTLVELLAVVVIMGIIIGISIPAVTAVQKRLVKQRVNTFFSIVDEAVDAYVEQYHTDFEKTRDCFEISYKDLIDQELLKETDITCLSEAYTGVDGKVIATRVNGGETFTYTHYLTCYDKETNKQLSKSEQIPEGCLGVNGGFSLDVNAIHVKSDGGEEPYVCTRPDDNECWVSGSIRYELSSTSPYYNDIKEFQYRNLGAIKWESIEASGVGTGSKLFSTANNTNYEQSSMSEDIKFRAIDTGNNISSESINHIRIDNTVPVVTIAPENGSFNNWTKDPLKLTLSAGNAPSGISRYIVDDNGTITEIEATDSVATYTVNHNLNGTIKVKAISKTGIEGQYKESDTIMVDIDPPSCESKGGNSNWTNGNITLTGICTDDFSGCASDVSKPYNSNTNSTTESPGTVYDVAGNSKACPSNQTVRIDKTAPTYSSSVSGSTAYINCSDALSGYASGNKSVTLSTSPTTVSTTCVDKAGNTKDASQKFSWDACASYSTKIIPSNVCIGLGGGTGGDYTVTVNGVVAKYTCYNGCLGDTSGCDTVYYNGSCYHGCYLNDPNANALGVVPASICTRLVSPQGTHTTYGGNGYTCPAAVVRQEDIGACPGVVETQNWNKVCVADKVDRTYKVCVGGWKKG